MTPYGIITEIQLAHIEAAERDRIERGSARMAELNQAIARMAPDPEDTDVRTVRLARKREVSRLWRQKRHMQYYGTPLKGRRQS